ncbi:hypothetical protein [uncultured Shewanella sp.]|uniref:hypothetical protein n=1 Tax=uncultured Shewanella sp. TaxID=173975 RepID=UPI002628166B|nr:hypothetical protein [uncultured Shewanella sp.]
MYNNEAKLLEKMLKWHIKESKCQLEKIANFKRTKNYGAFFKFIDSELNPLHQAPWPIIKEKVTPNLTEDQIEELFLSGRITFPLHNKLAAKLMKLKYQVSNASRSLEEIAITNILGGQPDFIYREDGRASY